MIRIKRLSNVNERRVKLFDYSTTVYPGTPPNNASSTVFVISCIDPRYTFAVEEYLLQQLGPATNYDLFVLAGAALGGRLTGFGSTFPNCAIVSTGNTWREALFDHLQVAITLHNVTEIYIIDHANCGAYRECSGTETTAGHFSQFTGLRAEINAGNFYRNGQIAPLAKVAGSTIFTTIKGLIFEDPIGTRTTLRDYTNGVGSITTVGTFTFPPATTGAKVLILGCIDPRFSEILSSFLINYKDIQFQYDLFILAGASLGVNQSYNLDLTERSAGSRGTAYTNNILADSAVVGPLGQKWGATFFDHLKVAILLHNVTEVWVFDHLDCGAYKAIKFGSLAATDLNPNDHIPEIRRLQSYVKAVQPSLSFKGFIMDTAGKITKVIDDGLGSVIDVPLSPFGSSKVRSPTSDIIDLRHKASADFVLTKEYGANDQPGFGRKLEVTKLTPTPSKTTILNSKIGPLRSGLFNRNRL